MNERKSKRGRMKRSYGWEEEKEKEIGCKGGGF